MQNLANFSREELNAGSKEMKRLLLDSADVVVVNQQVVGSGLLLIAKRELDAVTQT